MVAHFHYVMVGGMVSAFFAGLHYWWPKITGRMYPEMWGRAGALIIFIGFNLTFFPQFILGYLGMPRRYHSYPPEFEVLNVLSSAGATILAVGYLLPLAYLTWSLFRGERAPANPWGATGLEWQTPSPPPTENFDRDPDRDRAALQLSAARSRPAPCLKPLYRTSSSIPARGTRRRPRSPACGCSWPPKCCSSAPCS